MPSETTALPDKIILPKTPDVITLPTISPEQNLIQKVEGGGDTHATIQTLAQTPDQKIDPYGRDVIGGQLITPTAIKVGETPEQARVRGWLRGINEAFNKKDSDAEKQANIQQIVDASKAAGVPQDAINDRLKSLGINVISREQTTAQNKSPEKTGNETSINQSLDYLSKLADSVLAGKTTPGAFQGFVDYLSRSDIPKNKIEELLKSKGINTARREEIKPTSEQPEPLIVKEIKDNPDIEKRKMDENQINLQQEKDLVKINYGNREWYSVKGTYQEIPINGSNKKFILTDQTTDAAYIPIIDTFYVSPQYADQLKTDPDMLTQGLLHEFGHQAYFSLNKNNQTELNNLFLQNPDLSNTLLRFGTALYTDKLPSGIDAGANYLQVHEKDNMVKGQNHLCEDGQRGIKDSRTLVTEVEGKQREIVLSGLITEFISYMSSLELGQAVFDKASNFGKARRGGTDPRYDLLKQGHDILNRNPNLKAKFNEFGIFKDNTPNLQKDLSALEDFNSPT